MDQDLAQVCWHWFGFEYIEVLKPSGTEVKP